MDSDKSVLQISASLLSANTFEDTSNPPGSVRSFSNFGDGACGEPLIAQHLIIDFTPKETDTDFVQKKVCAFWEFLSMKPQLKDIMVLPDPDMFRRPSYSNLTSDVRGECTDSFGSEAHTKERTAVSMLEFVEERGLIDRTFESRLPNTTCSLGSREYHEKEVPMDFDKPVQKREKFVLKIQFLDSGSAYQQRMKYCKRTQTVDFRPTKTDADVKNLCRKMRQWDDQNPRSITNPQHPCSSFQNIHTSKPR